MSTNSKGKMVRYLTIMSPICCCFSVPVPVSPITAKRTEPSFIGRVSFSDELARAATFAPVADVCPYETEGRLLKTVSESIKIEKRNRLMLFIVLPPRRYLLYG